MDAFERDSDIRLGLRTKLRQQFDGKIVRKDLTKKIKEGANVPVYVLEFLLGQYCSSDDPEVIEQGVANVKRILADNFVRPDEAQNGEDLSSGIPDSAPEMITAIHRVFTTSPPAASSACGFSPQALSRMPYLVRYITYQNTITSPMIIHSKGYIF